MLSLELRFVFIIKLYFLFLQGRTAKALKSLQFANPGRQTEFTPETSKREKRRLQTKIAMFNSDR